MTWFDANEHCKKEGGKLVEIDSEEENTALVEEINRKEYTNRKMNFWIGLTDLENEGDWRLVSNGKEASYLNWGLNQPDNTGGNENCARIRIKPLPVFSWVDTWSDIFCNSTAGYYKWISMHALCEFDPSTEGTTTEGTTTKGTTTKGTTTTTEDATTESSITEGAST